MSSYPVLPFFTQIVCHPSASYRTSTSSVNAISVLPSIDMWLSS
uniref:Uncharacterized protein n=1 Tax=Arundo donax TaxID=35708 RepID=A0A0A9BAE3_ARUDO